LRPDRGRFQSGGTAARRRGRSTPLVWLYEYAPGDFRARDFAPEPRRFRLGELRGPAECIGRPDYMIRFRAHGRAFQVEIILGWDAGRLRVTVTKLLSSILVHPPKGV
jgi:hypothetical protein